MQEEGALIAKLEAQARVGASEEMKAVALVNAAKKAVVMKQAEHEAEVHAKALKKARQAAKAQADAAEKEAARLRLKAETEVG